MNFSSVPSSPHKSIKENMDIEMEMEPLPGVEVEETSPDNKHAYSKEQKVKRYYSILREFMTYFHARSEPYGPSHQFTDEELRMIEPQDIGTICDT